MLEFLLNRNRGALSTEKAMKLVLSQKETKIQNRIVVVDFSTTKSFTDPNFTNMCLVVLSSDGMTGTLTHLQVNADVPRFVGDLKKLHKRRRFSVCLSGGLAIDDEFVQRVFLEMYSAGISISLEEGHSSIGGANHYRRATVFKDKVVVNVMPYGGNSFITTLMFPPFK